MKFSGSPFLSKGGVAATSTKMLRSLLGWSGRGGWFNNRLFGGLNEPPRLRRLRRLREILLMAQPPLLGHTAVQIRQKLSIGGVDFAGVFAAR